MTTPSPPKKNIYWSWADILWDLHIEKFGQHTTQMMIRSHQRGQLNRTVTMSQLESSPGRFDALRDRLFQMLWCSRLFIPPLQDSRGPCNRMMPFVQMTWPFDSMTLLKPDMWSKTAPSLVLWLYSGNRSSLRLLALISCTTATSIWFIVPWSGCHFMGRKSNAQKLSCSRWWMQKRFHLKPEVCTMIWVMLLNCWNWRRMDLSQRLLIRAAGYWPPEPWSSSLRCPSCLPFQTHRSSGPNGTCLWNHAHSWSSCCIWLNLGGNNCLLCQMNGWHGRIRTLQGRCLLGQLFRCSFWFYTVDSWSVGGCIFQLLDTLSLSSTCQQQQFLHSVIALPSLRHLCQVKRWFADVNGRCFSAYLLCLLQSEDIWSTGISQIHHGQIESYYKAILALMKRRMSRHLTNAVSVDPFRPATCHICPMVRGFGWFWASYICGKNVFISYLDLFLHFISFHFISFHFISFLSISFHFISFHFISFHFISWLKAFTFVWLWPILCMPLTDDGKASIYRKILTDESVVEQPNSLAATSSSSGPVLEILDDADDSFGLDSLALAACKKSSDSKPLGDANAVQVLRPSGELRAQPKAKSASAVKGASTKRKSATHVTCLVWVSGLVSLMLTMS